MTQRRGKPSKVELMAIYAKHGHRSGNGLNLYSIKDKKKYQVKNPIFDIHTHSNGRTIVASNGQNIYQIVHHKR